MIELLIAITVFTLVLLVSMYAAVSGFRMFGHTNVRQQLQRDSASVFAWLRQDLESTNLLRCFVRHREVSGNDRDCLGAVGMESWREPILKDVLGHPKWDRVLVYTATREDKGHLFRRVLVPDAARVPLSKQDVINLLDGSLKGTYPVHDQRRLASGLKVFKVEHSREAESLFFTMKISQTVLNAGSGQPKAEVLEVQTAIYPRNTFPRL